MLTGKPSALAKKITELLCECDPPLQCCAAETAAALWRKRLPPQIRARIAGMSLKSDFETVLSLADDVYASMNADQVASVTNFTPSANSGETEEVAAVRQHQQSSAAAGSRGKGRWNGGRGSSRARGQSRGRVASSAIRPTVGRSTVVKGTPRRDTRMALQSQVVYSIGGGAAAPTIVLRPNRGLGRTIASHLKTIISEIACLTI